MTFVHGIDSYNPATLRVDPSNGHPIWSGNGGETLWSFAARRYGGPPPFWGRYLNDSPGVGITAQEAALLRTESDGACRLLLVYNELSSRDVLGLRGDAAREAGQAAAAKAVQLASRLGLRPGVVATTRLFLDLERWPVTPDLLLGWFERMADAPFLGLGGLYGRVFPSFSGADVRTARRRTGRHDWQQGGAYPWSRGLEWTVGRYAEERSTREIVADILGGDLARHRDYSVTLWDPHYVITNDSGPAPTPPARFRPGLNPGAPTTIWQYGRDVAIGGDIHLFDLNLATPQAYAEMARLD